MPKLFILFCSVLLIPFATAQVGQPSLEEVSKNLNKELPQVYDHATKLVGTSVESTNFAYHFILKATAEEFAKALPKVKSQILYTICSKPRERALLVQYKANVVYKYESEKGLSLGEFVVRPEHCQAK